MAQTDKMQPPADRPYKKHLDDAASHQTDDYREPGVVQKVVEKAAATKTQEAEEAPALDPSEQPARPAHDEHIENFVREQHRQDSSKILEGHKQ
ncbi:hypothetical protein LLEC1_01001 [Akanthomyces lecanii]|uniref:Uncharacterized protein n=1 Tax=Cordyceps confragosa TaxID=2714763 RepID=A0A179ICG1_CORDF|nr:hypothetical protein LLEC1_01001 [Akanthomyces lecanii]